MLGKQPQLVTVTASALDYALSVSTALEREAFGSRQVIT